MEGQQQAKRRNRCKHLPQSARLYEIAYADDTLHSVLSVVVQFSAFLLLPHCQQGGNTLETHGPQIRKRACILDLIFEVRSVSGLSWERAPGGMDQLSVLGECTLNITSLSLRSSALAGRRARLRFCSICHSVCSSMGAICHSVDTVRSLPGHFGGSQKNFSVV